MVKYKNPWITLREDVVLRPDGSESVFGVVETLPSVFIVAVTPQHKVLFVRLYRYPIGQESWEIPAGGTDGEDPHGSAQRELQEETGYTAKELQLVGSFFPNNGLSTQKSYVFLARGLEQSGSDEMQAEGITQLSEFSWEEIDEMLKSGELSDDQVIAALTLARLWLQPD